MRNVPSSEEVRNQAVAMVRAGDTLEHVAAALAVSASTVGHWCFRAGIRLKRRGGASAPATPAADRAAAVARVAAGEPVKSVARSFNVSYGAVRHWCGVAGVRLDPRGYSHSTRAEAVARVAAGEARREVALALGVSVKTVYEWAPVTEPIEIRLARRAAERAHAGRVRTVLSLDLPPKAHAVAMALLGAVHGIDPAARIREAHAALDAYEQHVLARRPS